MGRMPQKRITPAEPPPKVSTKASGYLLTGGGHLFFTSILLLAVWYGKEALAVLASLMLAAALFSRGWSRLSLAGVRGRLLLAERRAFPGDVLSGRVRLVNRKPLPLPWVELEQALPAGLTPVLTHSSGGTFGDGKLRYAASLGWYRALQWRIGFACARRGYFPLSPPNPDLRGPLRILHPAGGDAAGRSRPGLSAAHPHRGTRHPLLLSRGG